MEKTDSISIIIPVHNEEANLGNLLESINRIRRGAWEIIVIDDGSEDDSARIAIEKGVTLIKHPYCMGNGAAVKTGLRNAKGDIIIIMDGDGQHRAEDIPALLREMDRYDMVVGARDFLSHNGFMRGFGNRIYNILASYVAHKRIVDLTSGFRAVKRDIVKRFIYMLPNTFSYPSTLTLALMRSGHSVGFVPIITGQRKGKSKLKIFKDGARFFLIIIKIATIFSPFRIFLPISVFLLSLGIVYYLYWFITAHRFTNMSLLLILLGVIVFLMGLISEQINQLRYDRTEE